MKISYNWLKLYLDLDESPDKVADYLTGCGLEVESLELYQSVRGGLRGVVIGEVLTCVKHPNSDHLSITTVSTGSGEPLPVVCGASNVAAGQKVALATVGTTLYMNDRELTIQRAKIRGEVSEGMICAEDELGLGTSHDGIMVLPESAVPGTPAADYFKVEEDWVFTIGLTPNRVDAASHLGVARDLVAVINNSGRDTRNPGPRKALKLPDISAFRPGSPTHSVEVVVDDPAACARYSGITLTGLSVKESPSWLKNKLQAVGLRPINNIVDITNFVLMETGHPLHAFDLEKVTGRKVIVKKCSPGTRFTTLDGVERELTANDLMICNAVEPMCIGGVFGGEGSGVTGATTSIFLESAWFDPVHIRRSAKHHGLQTDASFRFERGANYEITVFALQRAANLMAELAGGIVSSGIIDVYPKPFAERNIALDYRNLDRLAGKVLDREVVQDILRDLGFIAGTDMEPDEGLLLTVPPAKVDVTREADVIEEILRIYGYNNIEIRDEVRASLSYTVKPDPGRFLNMVSDFLAASGFHEIMNNSLTRSAYYEENPDFPSAATVRILNPLSRDLDAMRMSLLHGGLESIVYNQNRRVSDLRLFEYGTVYSRASAGDQSDPLPGYHEEQHLALFMTGNTAAENWNAPSRETGFFELKGLVTTLLGKMGIGMKEFEIRTETPSYLSEGLVYTLKDKALVTLGQISRSLLKAFDSRQPVYYADLHWNAIFALIPAGGSRYRELPRFPEVRRDLALVLDRETTFGQIEKTAFQAERKLLRKVGLFDVYEGDKIAEGKKSYAVSFILQDEEKTLTDKEIEKVMERLIRAFAEKLNASLR